jgi:hypothetical protein
MYRMDFSVNPRAVAGLADALDLRAHNLTGAAGYLQAYSSLRFGAGLVNELFRTHEQVMSTVQTFLRHIGDDYAEAYAAGVSRAVASYLGTDQDARARLDASLPGVIDPAVPARPADQSAGPEIFADPSCLSLATPPDFEAEYPYHPHWYDLLSPSSIARDVIWYGTGVLAKLGLFPAQVDPYESFTAPLCGDWAGLERVSYALTQVARALAFVSARIDDEAMALDRVWTGHAAGNCRYALRRFARDLGPAQDLVVQLAADYHQVAVTAREQGEALGTLVTLLVDLAGSFGTEAVFDTPKLVEVSGELGGLIEEAAKIVELLHASVEGANGHLTGLCHQLGLLTVRPFAVNLPDDMPALPVPAGR